MKKIFALSIMAWIASKAVYHRLLRHMVQTLQS